MRHSLRFQKLDENAAQVRKIQVTDVNEDSKSLFFYAIEDRKHGFFTQLKILKPRFMAKNQACVIQM